MVNGLYSVVIGLENDKKWLIETLIVERLIIFPLLMLYGWLNIEGKSLLLIEFVPVMSFGVGLFYDYGKFSLIEYCKWLYCGTDDKIK